PDTRLIGAPTATGTAVFRFFISPRVELLHGWIGGMAYDVLPPEVADPYPDCPACCFANGYVLRFKAPLVDQMPATVVQDLIAHELAHVFQYAHGYTERFGEAEPPEGNVEEDADELMESWGFDVDSPDEWAVQTGRRQVIVCKDLTEYIFRLY